MNTFEQAAAATGRGAGAFRPDIQGLRAIAVLSVLFGHAFPNVLSGGFVGVDVFFVISGFLITGLIIRDIDDGRFSVAAFYRRRVRRILPASGPSLAPTPTLTIAGARTATIARSLHPASEAGIHSLSCMSAR